MQKPKTFQNSLAIRFKPFEAISKVFSRCCWNLKISHLTLGFQVEPTFHNFSTLVTPMAGQTPVVCFQSQPRVPPMHKNPFSGFPGQLSADGWIGRQVNLDRCVFTRGDSQVITSRIPSLYCRKQTSLEPNCGFLLVQTHYRKKEKSAIVWKHFINTAGGGAAILKKGRVYSTSCLEPGRPPGRIRPLLTVLTHTILTILIPSLLMFCTLIRELYCFPHLTR